MLNGDKPRLIILDLSLVVIQTQYLWTQRAVIDKRVSVQNVKYSKYDNSSHFNLRGNFLWSVNSEHRDTMETVFEVSPFRRRPNNRNVGDQVFHIETVTEN